MDFLKAEIEKKRKLNKAAEEAVLSKQEPHQGDEPRKKYIKRGLIEQERERKYIEEDEKEKVIEEAKKQEIEKQEKLNTKKTEKEKPEEAAILTLPQEEVIKRLRVRGQPITFFGETDILRAERLRKLEEREPVEYIEGMDDDFGKSLRALDKQEEQPETKEEENEPEEQVEDNSRESVVLKTFGRLMKEWNIELQDRTEIQKRSAQGKIDTVTYKQCRRNIKPLFKLLRSKTLPHDILGPIFEMAKFSEAREYVKANSCYLKLAIGNAPWPMGVTMVGIHERSAREKIFSNQVAHVLNDETQRKYIQSLKRLMTYSQKRYPTDPSKTVG